MTSSVINNIFDAVYVINLDRAVDRLKDIDGKLKKIGIRYTRISAVEGRKLSVDEIKAESSSSCANFCIYGAIGCALSHKKIWKDVVKRNYQKVLILEDDANFADNFDQRFLSSWKAVPNDWELVHLGAVIGGGDRYNYTWFDWLNTVPLMLSDTLSGVSMNRGQAVDPEGKVLIPDINAGSHAYAVTLSGCKKLLKCIPKITYPGHIDLLIAYRASHLLNRYAFADPDLIAQPTIAKDSSIASAGSPNLANYLLDHISLTKRGTQAGWVMSSSIARVGPSVQISCWRLVWFILGFFLGLQRLPIFALAMLADDFFLGSDKNRNIKQLIFDILLFAGGAFLSMAMNR